LLAAAAAAAAITAADAVHGQNRQNPQRNNYTAIREHNCKMSPRHNIRILTRLS